MSPSSHSTINFNPGSVRVRIFTDGACSGNPGPGGWGALLVTDKAERELKGGTQEQTTNNRMELIAVIESLEALKRTCHVDLFTDSKYVHDGISKWIKKWKKNGWKNSKKEAVLNTDLWIRLDKARSSHKVEWHWVKGHAAHPQNERAHELAQSGMKYATLSEPK
ncbi:MAG: ribonuclease HI [Alphaproteobacteria bacterium]|nr:ribonuclease HI [Alphaproteobacteria bacterium]